MDKRKDHLLQRARAIGAEAAALVGARATIDLSITRLITDFADVWKANHALENEFMTAFVRGITDKDKTAIAELGERARIALLNCPQEAAKTPAGAGVPAQRHKPQDPQDDGESSAPRG
jgi:hypothetical protein